MDDGGAADNIRVYCRVRPLQKGSRRGIAAVEDASRVVINNKQSFNFGWVAGPDSTQEAIFENVGKPLAQSFLDGCVARPVACMCAGQLGMTAFHSPRPPRRCLQVQRLHLCVRPDGCVARARTCAWGAAPCAATYRRPALASASHLLCRLRQDVHHPRCVGAASAIAQPVLALRAACRPMSPTAVYRSTPLLLVMGAGPGEGSGSGDDEGEHRGLLPRVLEYIFDALDKRAASAKPAGAVVTTTCKASFLEVSGGGGGHWRRLIATSMRRSSLVPLCCPLPSAHWQLSTCNCRSTTSASTTCSGTPRRPPLQPQPTPPPPPPQLLAARVAARARRPPPPPR